MSGGERISWLVWFVVGGVVALAVVMWGGGRGDGDASPVKPSASSLSEMALPLELETAEETKRVVTLAPAISQMMVDLGVGERIVGVAEYDVSAPAGLPIVGNFLDINHEALLAAKPDLVLLMSTARQGVPRVLGELGASGRFEVGVFDYPKTIRDVMGTLWREGEGSLTSVGGVLAMEAQASALRQKLEMQLVRLRALTDAMAGERPRVLMVIGLNPVMAVGPGQVLDEMLSIAGGDNAAGDATVGAPTFDRENLIATKADVVLLLMPDAMELAADWTDDPRLAEFERLSIPAVEHERFVVVNDPLVLLPSTSLVGVTLDMARAIHPELVEAIDAIETGGPTEAEGNVAGQ